MRGGKYALAYRIGSQHAYAGRPMWDTLGEDSALLMTELGETTPTTARNQGFRAVLCDFYEDGYYTARSALGRE